MSTIIWSTDALANLRSIRAYIEQFNPRAAANLAKGLVEAGDSLAHFPHRGRSVPKTDLRVRIPVILNAHSIRS